MKKIISIILVIVLCMTCLGGCLFQNYVDDETDKLVGEKYNIIFKSTNDCEWEQESEDHWEEHRKKVEALNEKELKRYYRKGLEGEENYTYRKINILSLKEDDDNIAKDLTLIYLYQGRYYFDMHYYEDSLIFVTEDENYKESQEYKDFLEANDWEKEKIMDFREFPHQETSLSPHYAKEEYWDLFNREHVRYGNIYIRPNFETFAKEVLGVVGVCNNVIEDEYGRTIGGILYHDEEGDLKIQAVAIDRYMDDNKFYYDENVVLREIGIDTYYADLQQLKADIGWDTYYYEEDMEDLTLYQLNEK